MTKQDQEENILLTVLVERYNALRYLWTVTMVHHSEPGFPRILREKWTYHAFVFVLMQPLKVFSEFNLPLLYK